MSSLEISLLSNVKLGSYLLESLFDTYNSNYSAETQYTPSNANLQLCATVDSLHQTGIIDHTDASHSAGVSFAIDP